MNPALQNRKRVVGTRRLKALLVLPQILFLLSWLASPSACAQAGGQRYWSDTWRGWHFYEEPVLEQPEPALVAPKPAIRLTAPATKAAAPPVDSSTGPRAPELVEFERLQKALEQTRNIAIMRPSEANVRRYMELESQVVGRASYFADVAQRVAWTTPELDPTLQGRPVGAQALDVFERQQSTSRAQTVADLAQDHALLFFFRSDCPYCHAIAPILQAFHARYGIKVVAIGLDSGPLPGFADARRDNGIATTLRVTQVPAIFLAQPFTGDITPIGFGVLTVSQLLESISVVSAVRRDAASSTSIVLRPIETPGPSQR